MSTTFQSEKSVEFVYRFLSSPIYEPPNLVNQINSLLIQLTPDPQSFEPIDESRFCEILSKCMIYSAWNGNKLVGMATLANFKTLMGNKGFVEDVVTDSSARKQGIGRKLIQGLERRARLLGISELNLTSHPSRVAANALYQNLGYEKRETNVYRKKL